MDFKRLSARIKGLGAAPLRLRANPWDVAFVCAFAMGAFLRLVRINAVPFWKDSAGTFALAHDILTLHGLPVTGINSSIGTLTPPAAVYVYLLPSLLGSPTLGAVETAFANLAAIALMYYLCRRYLNPAIGLVTALLASVSAGSVTFSRFIWQPNMQMPFTVLLIALVLAGIAAKRSGWLLWALPVEALAIQMHPVTASLAVLLLIGWLLSPETVKLRDVVIGGALAIALFIPTFIFEVMSGFLDIHVYQHIGSAPPVLDDAVFQRFLEVNSLFQTPLRADAPLYGMLNAAWLGLILGGMCYVALRVIVPGIRGLRKSLAVDRWHAQLVGPFRWMRAEAQTRWRVDLVVLLWPTLILLTQVRHATHINIHYVLAIFPAQFLAVAILVYDVGALIPRVRLVARMPAGGAFALCVVLLIAVCITQVVGISDSYREPQPTSLEAEQADLALAQQLAQQYHVSLVVFQTDYQAREPTAYLLRTRYAFAAPTQIMASGHCLAGAPVEGERVLYLMNGERMPWEAFITQIPGVYDLLSDSRADGFFRAYVVTASELVAHMTPIGRPVTPMPVMFAGRVMADGIWRIPLAGKAQSAMVLQARVLESPTVAPFHTMYGFSAAARDVDGRSIQAGSMSCNMDPWIPWQRLYYLIPQITPAGLTRGSSLTLSARESVFNPGDLRLGPLRLLTAYDLTSVQYLIPPTSSQTLAVSGCGRTIVCADAGTATLRLGA